MLGQNEVYAVLLKHDDGEFGVLTTVRDSNSDKALAEIKVKRNNWVNTHFPMADIKIGIVRYTGSGAWSLVSIA